MSSSSYSALLRRSKLATYSPAIDQVYSTTSGHAARSQFGFKRPLPSATTKKAPFVRVTSLDNSQKRTEFRKATKETSFTKKWGEVPVGIQMSSRDGSYSAASAALSMAEASEVQSRFVPAQAVGAIKSVAQAKAGAEAKRSAPNFFLMEEEQFDRFLESLGERREEFQQFALEEFTKTQEGREATELDLYEHAQSNPTHLARLVERFLAFPSPSPTAAPLPHPHPTLALQYSTPTPLESALAPPLPGRLLGPTTSRSNTSLHSNRSLLYTSILGQVSSIGQLQSGGASHTTFFPDASGTRSNAPGRTTFTIKPTVDPSAYASRVALSSRRGKVPFRSQIPSYEPQALASNVLDLHPTVSTTPPRPLPGTQSYSGDLPAPSAPKRMPFGSKNAVSLTEMMGQFGTSRRLNDPRSDLWTGKRRSFEEREVFRRNSNALKEERLATDGKAFGARGTRESRQAAAAAKRKSGGNAQEKRKDLVSNLQELLGSN
ncbi:hypothetical protein BCR35DRAFT_304531 [Leucosporidium creatinivorum]|uniref:Uncharacterized protein n=1 Tax=Leucosporidium creatinivorum TaxID=106004 RepID=A0A1Y2F731_9BASI|nr:hypothetical protein BCR35DRAFT_304531 [Leucosporidium creatinivorum]